MVFSKARTLKCARLEFSGCRVKPQRLLGPILGSRQSRKWPKSKLAEVDRARSGGGLAKSSWPELWTKLGRNYQLNMKNHKFGNARNHENFFRSKKLIRSVHKTTTQTCNLACRRSLRTSLDLGVGPSPPLFDLCSNSDAANARATMQTSIVDHRNRQPCSALFRNTAAARTTSFALSNQLAVCAFLLGIDGSRDLSDSWTSLTQFTLLEEKPPDGDMWSGRRLTRKQLTSRPDHLWPELWTKLGKKCPAEGEAKVVT